jgi:hypothetical protein
MTATLTRALLRELSNVARKALVLNRISTLSNIRTTTLEVFVGTIFKSRQLAFTFFV